MIFKGKIGLIGCMITLLEVSVALLLDEVDANDVVVADDDVVVGDDDVVVKEVLVFVLVEEIEEVEKILQYSKNSSAAKNLRTRAQASKDGFSFGLLQRFRR